MVIKTLHMEKFEYFCSRAVIVIGMVLFFFLSASSLLYTEEFEANNVERLERVKDPLAWNLFLMVLILLLLFYVGKWMFKDEAKKERNIRILLAFTCCYAVVYGLLCYLEKQDRKEMEFMAAAINIACLIRSNCYIVLAAIGFEHLFKILRIFWEKHPEKKAAVQSFAKALSVGKLESLAGNVILLASGIPSVFLFVYGLFFTTCYKSNDLEIPTEVKDPFLSVLLFVVMSLVILNYVGKWILQKEEHRKRNICCLLGAVLVHCFIFCMCWNLFAGSALRGDPLYIHALAGGFANGDVPLSAMDYLYTYPHQAGQALLLELVYRIFGYENLLAFRILNTAGVLGFVFCGFQVTEKLFHRDEVQVNFLVLAAGCLPLLIYTNVIYGEVLAVAWTAFALWMLLLWLKEGRIWQIVLMIIGLCFAVYMKNNALIAAVAIGIVMLLKSLSEKRGKTALWVFPMILALLISQSAMTKLYEVRGGWPLDQAMPKNLWIAMGLQGTGDNAGWWNEFPVRIYKEEAGYNPEAARDIGNAAIALSIQSFAENPVSAVRFFQQKFVSQWNNADYGCQVTAGSPKTPKLEFWMNGYHSLIFLGISCFAVLRLRRKREIEEVLPLLTILGGYLFHIFWEVKGRYGLFYFVLVLPVAAAGLWDLAQYIQSRKEKRHEQKKEFI